VSEGAAVPGPVTEAAVAAFVGAMRTLIGALPAAQWVETRDLVAYTTHLLLPRFNGLMVLGAGADEGTAARHLDELVDLDLPFAVFSRPSAPPWLAPLTTEYGLTTLEHEPFMCLAEPATVAGTAPGDVPVGLTIEAVDPADLEEVGTGARLLADGFEAPVELLAPLVAPEVLALPGMTAYVGRVDGQPRTTGFGAVTDGHVGVFNIATPPEHRGRGYGRAVTARVVADGVLAGARTAYLQASPMGLGVYQRMGFRTGETWRCHYPG
jgi:N-acetylglutamate synthase